MTKLVIGLVTAEVECTTFSDSSHNQFPQFQIKICPWFGYVANIDIRRIDTFALKLFVSYWYQLFRYGTDI